MAETAESELLPYPLVIQFGFTNYKVDKTSKSVPFVTSSKTSRSRGKLERSRLGLVSNKLSNVSVSKEKVSFASLILNNVQCGFRKGRSTVDPIIRLQDVINNYNHNKGFTVGVFIDFQSAFDMMWQSGLLVKLRNLVITGNTFSFIKKFLTHRTIPVKVGSALSQKYIIENGTAQGSIISPLLFLIMINDLPDRLKGVESSLFADDSCIFKSGNNLDHIKNYIQDSLDKSLN